MRIGIDMLAVQSPGSRHRGIGRLGVNLIQSLLALDQSNEYIFYCYGDLTTRQVPRAPNARRRRIGLAPDRGETTLAEVMDRLAQDNPDRLDLFLTLSPMESVDGYMPPAKPLNGLKLAAFVHDLIPFLFPQHYLTHPVETVRHHQRLQVLRRYDLLLANSDATRSDFLNLLKLPEDRVVTVSEDGDSRFFKPESAEMVAGNSAVLRSLGITDPFVFHVGGIDWRKNVAGMIDAFALLPDHVVRTHQLVLSYHMTDDHVRDIWRRASARGVADRLVVTNRVPDTTLRTLYQRCAVFAFPSAYEGFGLPILEAMRCGAPVIAGNNSSQIEVVGEGGWLVDAHDVTDLAAKLRRLVEDRDLARTLSQRGLVEAQRYCWERTARRALEALKSVVSNTGTGRGARPGMNHLRLDGRASRRVSPRPRLAVFSPMLPKSSAASDLTPRLLDELSHSYAIDLYHDSDYVPHLGVGTLEFGVHDYRLFARNAAVVPYRAVLYQMGNSREYRYIYETFRRHPGIVTLHDPTLAWFHVWYARQEGVASDHFETEVAWELGAPGAGRPGRVPLWAWRWEGRLERCLREGLALTAGIAARARGLVVPASSQASRLQARWPRLAERIMAIPPGADVAAISLERRSAVRARHGLPRDALVVASWGGSESSRLGVETLRAFEPLARAVPSARLVFVGPPGEPGDVLGQVEPWGLSDRVRFLSRQPMEPLADLIAVADLAVQVERPIAPGEPSGVLSQLLASGVPTIVTESEALADLPETVVRKVRWDGHGLDRLTQALRELADDPHARQTLGDAARRHAELRFAWPRVASAYGELIEKCSSDRRKIAGTSTPHGRPDVRRPAPC